MTTVVTTETYRGHGCCAYCWCWPCILCEACCGGRRGGTSVVTTQPVREHAPATPQRHKLSWHICSCCFTQLMTSSRRLAFPTGMCHCSPPSRKRLLSANGSYRTLHLTSPPPACSKSFALCASARYRHLCEPPWTLALLQAAPPMVSQPVVAQPVAVADPLGKPAMTTAPVVNGVYR